MPRARFPAGSGRKKQNAPPVSPPEVSSTSKVQLSVNADGQIQQHLAVAETDSRPRTRGWHKAEAERRRAASTATCAPAFRLTTNHQDRDLRPRKPPLQAQANPTRPFGRKNPKAAVKSVEKQNTAPANLTKQRPQKASKKRHKQVQSRLTVKCLYPQIDRNPSITEWLRRVLATESSDQSSSEKSHEKALNSSQQEMQSSRSTSRTPRSSVNDESTVKGVGRTKKLDWDKLKAREVDDDASKDPRAPHFEALLKWQLPRLSSEQVEEVQAIFQEFSQLAVSEIDYPQVESVSNKFDRWKSKVSLAQITEEHFSEDTARCTISNEAVLQRTIMMNIIDRHQLHQFLTFNSEGQWKQNVSDCLLSRDSDIVTLPKPDLNVSFKLQSFSRSAPIPGNLKKAFRPDSIGQKHGRCFPFLFFEVKKATESLDLALMANLHSASQALLNIYAWMVRAQCAEIFFEKVRVFTFVFNAQDLIVRMHRATRHEITLLQYHFVELVQFKSYTKDQVCLLVRKILENYAVEELHPILKLAFDTVTEEHGKSIQEKRSATFAQASAASRARRRGTPSLPLDDSTSFGLSALST